MSKVESRPRPFATRPLLTCEAKSWDDCRRRNCRQQKSVLSCVSETATMKVGFYRWRRQFQTPATFRRPQLLSGGIKGTMYPTCGQDGKSFHQGPMQGRITTERVVPFERYGNCENVYCDVTPTHHMPFETVLAARPRHLGW